MRYSINKKMIAGFCLVIVLMLVANVYITSTIYEISRTTGEIIDAEISAVTLSEQLKEITRRQEETAERFLAGRDVSLGDSSLLYSARFYTAMDSLFFMFSEPGSRGIPVMHRIAQLHAGFDSMVNARKDTPAHLSPAGAAAESLRALHDLFDQLILIHRETTGSRVAALERRTRTSIRVAVILTISTLFVALIIAYVIPRRITRPIDTLIRGVEGIGKGKLKPIRVESEDEVTLLAHAVNDLAGKLKETNELRAEVTQQILHEIQSPLGSILSAQFLLASREGIEPGGDEHQLLESIREGVERISGTIRQLLDIARLDMGKMEYHMAPEDLTALLQSVVDGLKYHAEGKSITISYHPRQLRTIMIDRQKMEVVFNNLLLNAIKFTGERGRIDISVRERSDSASIIFRDTGIGIEERHLPHIFTRFYTAGDTGKAGTGIGLSLAKAFTEGHGGTITVESRPGSGSTFTVDLPASGPGRPG